MATRSTPRIIDIDAGNESGTGRDETSLGVDGEHFTPGGKAQFTFTAGITTVAQGVAKVGPDGLVSWSTTIKPALVCESSVSVVGKDLSSGRETDEATSQVVCQEAALG